MQYLTSCNVLENTTLDEAVRLKLAQESEVFVEQGKTFTVSFECVDEDGNITTLGM
jgi:hypothetical protein